MDSPSATTACVLLALIFVWGMPVSRTIAPQSSQPVVIAGDIPIRVSERDERDEGMTGRVKDLGRLAWDMVHAIEREHVASPDRRELIDIVIRVLTRLDEGPAHAAAVEEFAACKNVEEFAESLCQQWSAGNRAKMALEQIPDRLIREFGTHLGELRLTPMKAYLVEDQIRNNRYVGLGVRMGAVGPHQFHQFQNLIPGGPAERGGLKDGTHVHEVDGHSTLNQSMETVIDWIRGPAGTDVTLKVTDADSTNERTVTLTRGVVRFDSLFDRNNLPLSRGKLRNDGVEPNGLDRIGWIRFQDITSSTLSELRAAEVKARLESVRLMVFDFRSHSTADNLHRARLVADSLLDGGMLWNRTERGGQPQPEIADRECLFRGIPLVVLVNQHTGAAHCAIATALQDAGRATLVGDSPNFIGVVTSTVQLPDVPFALTMPTARLTRARRDRHWPLEPDHPVGDRNTRVDHLPALLNQTVTYEPTFRRPLKKAAPAATADAAVSALLPANVKSRAIWSSVQRIRNPFGQPANEIPITPVPLVKAETIDEVAIRVAKELLKTVPENEYQ